MKFALVRTPARMDGELITKKVTEAGANSAGKAAPVDDVATSVAAMVREVRRRGGDAVREYSLAFDGSVPVSFRISESEIAAAVRCVPRQTLSGIRTVPRRATVPRSADLDPRTRPVIASQNRPASRGLSGRKYRPAIGRRRPAVVNLARHARSASSVHPDRPGPRLRRIGHLRLGRG
jgi:hypothetical protein